MTKEVGMKRSSFSGKTIAGLAIAALATGAVAMLPAEAMQKPATARQIHLDVGLANPVLLSDGPQKTHVKIGLTGFVREADAERTPVNVAIVLDKSGSMQGEKIAKAREAALMAVERLDKDDVFSFVTYDSRVRVVVPATRISDRTSIRRAINSIRASGNTALFAGVSKGAQEVRKFLDTNRVNRVILLSDGLANVGLSSPSDLGQLGAALSKEGISVTTIGLGLDYNEDLMVELARRSDGNHGFAENATDLARLFNAEFGDVLSVVAQEVEIRIRCADGIRPIRVLGRDAEITGQEVISKLNQLYSEQEKFFILEVEVPPGNTGVSRKVATVDVTYANMATKTNDRLTGSLEISYTDSPDTVKNELDKEIRADVVEQEATEANKRAVELRDEGKVTEAKQVLLDNAGYLKENAQELQSDKLDDLSVENEEQARDIEEKSKWKLQRKSMRKGQYKSERQQSY
jgi:Ca-activated chloride channel family protein